MQSVFANKSATITVDLIVGGNFVQPDADSVVKYTLLGNDFSPMDDYTDRELFIPPSTSLSVVIPAEANTIVEHFFSTLLSVGKLLRSKNNTVFRKFQHTRRRKTMFVWYSD